MPKRELPRRTKILIGLLFVCIVIYAYATLDQKRTKRNLESAAQAEIARVQTAENDLVCEVTVSRPYIVFGPAVGKVDVYVRQRQPVENPPIHVVNYYYTESKGSWKLDGSSASASEESHQKGLLVFKARKPAVLQAAQ